MDINNFQEEVRSLSQKLDTRSPEQRIMYLVTELGEVVEEVIALTSAGPNVPAETIMEMKGRIGLEIYDLIWNAVDLANMLEIDLNEAFNSKAAYNETRRWSRSGYVKKGESLE